MPQDRTRKIVITGIMGAIAVFLGVTGLGFIPWFTGISVTILQVPVIIGAVLEGPIVGLIIGLIFGLFSLIQAAVAPTLNNALFVHPLISILPRLFIGPAAWLVWCALKKVPVAGLIAAGLAGSITNTVLVLGMIGILGYIPSWALIGSIAVANGGPEALVTAVIVLVVVAAWMHIQVGRKKGASL